MAQKTDSRPLFERKLSVELRIAALENALFQAKECHKQIQLEVERADTIPAPPMPANDNADFDVDFEVDCSVDHSVSSGGSKVGGSK